MFKKSEVVGVSISPEKGIELAQIDYATGTILKYGQKPISYNIVKREITDLDLFKDSLQDLLEEMAIPKGAELVLNFPTITYRVKEYPASLEKIQVESAIEEELYENPYLQNYEPCFDCITTSSSLQFNRYVYTALRKSSVIEIILAIKDLGYKVRAIDTSVSSVFRSLKYLDLVNTEADTNWVLLFIENNCCRILSMLGINCIDSYEENISIGEVLSDAENYSTVISAVDPILKNLPSKYLCVVSKTNVISAEVISNKIAYSSPIVYQEANSYLKEPFLPISSLVEKEQEKQISLDVIGAAIYKDFNKTQETYINLFNKTLGDIYLSEQPITIMNGKVVLTNELLLFLFAVFFAVLFVSFIFVFGWFTVQEKTIRSDIEYKQGQIARIQEFLDKNKNISASTFDEGDEIKMGLVHNKNIYSYYTIVGTEIPQKLWLTHLKLGEKITIEGQADNLESVYVFFRNIRDYSPNTDIRIQRLELASVKSNNNIDDIDSDILINSSNADFYSFNISNEIETNADVKPNAENNDSKSAKTQEKSNLPELEVIQ